MQQESTPSPGFYDDEAIDLMLEQCFISEKPSVVSIVEDTVTEPVVIRQTSNVSSKDSSTDESSVGLNHSFIQVGSGSCIAADSPSGIQRKDPSEAEYFGSSLLDSPKVEVSIETSVPIEPLPLPSELFTREEARTPRAVSPAISVPTPSIPSVRPPTIASAPSVSTAPVRGRVFTQPAWMTAGVLPGLEDEEEDRNSSLCTMESEIERVKAEITELASLIEQKKKQRDALRQRYAASIGRIVLEPVQQAAAAPPGLTPNTLTVNLEKSPTTPLGLSVGFDSEQGCFIVNEVRAQGCVPDYNRMCREPNKRICPRDSIMAVNGVRGDRVTMTAQFASPRIQLDIRVGDNRSTGNVAARSSSEPTFISSATWPKSSMEVYEEIIDAVRKSEFQRTGIMNTGDVPVRLPEQNGMYWCHICGSEVGDWVEHFRSLEHADSLGHVSTKDLWTKYALQRSDQGTLYYWYEHRIGFWSIRDPNENRSGCHTCA